MSCMSLTESLLNTFTLFKKNLKKCSESVSYIPQGSSSLVRILYCWETVIKMSYSWSFHPHFLSFGLTFHSKKPIHLHRLILAGVKSWKLQVFQLQMPRKFFLFGIHCRDGIIVYCFVFWIKACQAAIFCLVYCFRQIACNVEIFTSKGHKDFTIQTDTCEKTC